MKKITYFILLLLKSLQKLSFGPVFLESMIRLTFKNTRKEKQTVCPFEQPVVYINHAFIHSLIKYLFIIY